MGCGAGHQEPDQDACGHHQHVLSSAHTVFLLDVIRLCLCKPNISEKVLKVERKAFVKREKSASIL